jgi:sulfur relay (sulfurtransferase) DsrF/TusC family protein
MVNMVVIRHGPRQIFRVIEGLRLSVAMLGMDEPPLIVFLDGGVECLRPGVFEDPVMLDYLRASADLAGIQVLEESLKEVGFTVADLDPSLGLEAIDLERLVEMMGECKSVVAF